MGTACLPWCVSVCVWGGGGGERRTDRQKATFGSQFSPSTFLWASGIECGSPCLYTANSLSTVTCCQLKSLELTNGVPQHHLLAARWKFLGAQLQPAAPGIHHLEEPGVGLLFQTGLFCVNELHLPGYPGPSDLLPSPFLAFLVGGFHPED